MTALPRSASRLQLARSGLADSTEFPNTQRAACYDLVKSMFGLKNRNGRIISPPFEDLPARAGNESYYRSIPDPRSMRMVLERLSQNGYPTAREVYVDLKLCFSNWSFICSRTSRDWQDTVKMDQTVDERWEIQANDGNLPTVDEMFPDEPSAAPLQAANRSTSPEDAPAPTPAPAAPVAATTAAAGEAASPAPPSASAAAKRERAESPSSEASVPSRPSKKPRRDSGDVSRADSPSNPAPMGAAYATTPLLERPRVNDTGSAWLVAPPAGSVTIESVMASILSSIREERDYSLPGGTGLPLLARLPELQRLPERAANSSYFQKVNDPVSLEMVELRVRNNQYSDPADFDKDLHSAFRSAAIYFRDEPIRLGAVFLLQRLYQELTKGDGRKGSAVNGTGGKSSVAAGPGTATPAATVGGAATPASASKVRPSEQVLLHDVKYKEDTFRVGDFVHLMNPDDCTKPIIGQIFKLWKDPASADRHVHVCWYYRPEQTVHIPTRRFIENEVFRSYSFVDHAVEDVLERCLVMFHTRFLRGRPKAPYWTPTMPTYICEHRYKEDSKSFKKIKNWTSCIPVELRDQDEDANFTHYPTPLPNQSLRRVPSPFLRGEKGPGGVGQGEGMEVMDKEQWKYHASEPRAQQQHAPAQQQQPRPAQQPSAGGGQPHQEQARPSDPTKIVRLGKDMTSMPELAARQEHFDKLPDSLSKHFKGDAGEGDLLWFASPPIRITPREPVRNSLAYLDFVAKKGTLPTTNGTAHVRADLAGQDGATRDESVEEKQIRLLHELIGGSR